MLVKLDERNFYTVDHAPLPWPKEICDTNADASSVCGS